MSSLGCFKRQRRVHYRFALASKRTSFQPREVIYDRLNRQGKAIGHTSRYLELGGTFESRHYRSIVRSMVGCMAISVMPHSHVQLL
jgi:hypothetical protein